MRITRIVPAALVAMGLAGCSNFLNSDKATTDPNSPAVATRNQLFVGAQANVFGQQEGGVAMIVCEWMQQCAGVNGRFVDTQGKYNGVTAASFDFQFSDIYRGGGLLSLRAIQTGADADGDKYYKGIAEVLEAMDIGYAADIWGNIPYSEAGADNPTPTFDPQMTVYDKLQTLLDQAITDMGGAGAGPGAFDLVYGNLSAAEQKTAWIETAHTLKARLYLHTVEKTGAGQYAKALAEAQKGISTPNHDWKTLHSTATSERNLWAQFQVSSFGNDLVAGSALVALMVADNDQRLSEYFGKNPSGGYGGYNVHTGDTPVPQISPIAGSARTNNVSFRQPIMTYDENQLIIAEAQLVGGNGAAAATAYNIVRARYNKSTKATVTLADIINEKYILLFQNLETWNDYKRTCLPLLLPAKDKTTIPGRLYYGQTEEQTNPNTPASTTQSPLASVRNPNDPNACQ